MFSNFVAEQKTVQSWQLGMYGSQPEPQRNIRKLRRLIKVRNGMIGNKMAEVSLVVEAPVHGYHVYMDQQEAAINAHDVPLCTSKNPCMHQFAVHSSFGLVGNSNVSHVVGYLLECPVSFGFKSYERCQHLSRSCAGQGHCEPSLVCCISPV